MTDIREIPLTRIDGAADKLANHAGKVLLVVNVASKCGLTPQYEGLETLYRTYKDQGLEVLGFPANDFGAQEPGTNEEIASFCSTNYGVSFGNDALAITDGDKGGSFNGDAHSGTSVMIFLNNTAVLNFSAGFDTGFSFYYATPNTPGSVSVYSGLNKTGTLLGTIDLPINGPGSGPGGIYSNWSLGSLAFDGVAHSIDFGGTANYIAYDDVTFGATAPVPEPQVYSLLLAGLAVVGAIARRRRA